MGWSKLGYEFRYRTGGIWRIDGESEQKAKVELLDDKGRGETSFIDGGEANHAVAKALVGTQKEKVGNDDEVVFG